MKIVGLVGSFILMVGMAACTPHESVYSNLNMINEAYLDPSTGVFLDIDYTHHEIHEGYMFSYSEVTDVANSANRDLLIITPDNLHQIHIVIKVETEAEAGIFCYEDTDTLSDGTPVTAFNRNRNSNRLPEADIYHSPTINSNGTLISTYHWGGGKSFGGEERTLNEWVLASNTKYLIRVTNFTVSDNQIAIALVWYENNQ